MNVERLSAGALAIVSAATQFFRRAATSRATSGVVAISLISVACLKEGAVKTQQEEQEEIQEASAGGHATDGDVDSSLAEDSTSEGPTWTDIGTVGSCAIQLLEQPRRWSSFEWRNCPSGPGCELAETTMLIESVPSLAYEASVVEGAQGTLAVGSTSNVAFVSDGEGSTLAAIRTGEDCIIGHVHIWRETVVAALSAASGTGRSVEGFVRSEHPFERIDIVAAPRAPAGVPSIAALGERYWMQVWTPSDRIYSLDLAEPDAFVELPSQNESVVATSWAHTTGLLFYFTETLSDTPTRMRIVRSDGRSALEAYIEHADRSAGAFAFADTHVGWHEATGGTGRASDGFDSVEIWGSEWRGDDSTLRGEPLASAPSGLFAIPSSAVGGHGYYAAGTRDRDLNPVHLVADLQTGEVYTEAFPAEMRVLEPAGVTKSHVYYRAAGAAFVRTTRRRSAE